ncbi:hypothetical protein AB9M92_25915 [Peribacillus frigoritolerans]|uniref:hypothetical protein n=1 Tax=Peribacillus frigoritolerans TaxID=450367 RepID=UPI0035117A65
MLKNAINQFISQVCKSFEEIIGLEVEPYIEEEQADVFLAAELGRNYVDHIVFKAIFVNNDGSKWPQPFASTIKQIAMKFLEEMPVDEAVNAFVTESIQFYLDNYDEEGEEEYSLKIKGIFEEVA